jgi:hypothetical protein
MKNNFLFILLSLLIALTLISCSFVEPLPGEHHITQVSRTLVIPESDPQSDLCKTLKEMLFETKTTTFFIERSDKAIAEELQILARNEAIRSRANAIWPITEIENGKQSFLILRCARN